VNRIRLLPDHVANQIAAGEVVERPASVVKELVENALDAGATRLTVEIGAGGRSLIRVTDDGTGMSRDDALLCLERHATSKIQRTEDLTTIATMGFRGEAIPSIASVSRFTLTTRERDNNSGEATQIIINGGKIVEVKAAASPTGTAVEVRQLFFNLPARRKFLRTEETERAHIAHYLTLISLAWPGVGFTFVSDGRPVWQLPPVKWITPEERFAALRERLRQLHGADVPLLPVEFTAQVEEAREEVQSPKSKVQSPDAVPASTDFGLRTSDFGPPPTSHFALPTSHFRVWGFIGAPGVSRSTRDEQHLFVNQRPVENRGLNFALLEGYHTALMRGRYPVCCLFLELDPAAVDVNVHPQKREVKFREEQAVRRLVAKAVRDTLLAFHGSTGSAGGEVQAGGQAGRPAGEQGRKWAGEKGQPALGAPTSSISPGADPAAAQPNAPTHPLGSPPPGGEGRGEGRLSLTPDLRSTISHLQPTLPLSLRPKGAAGLQPTEAAPRDDSPILPDAQSQISNLESQIPVPPGSPAPRPPLSPASA
jgi:DNA mismatch repair protein MutL